MLTVRCRGPAVCTPSAMAKLVSCAFTVGPSSWSSPPSTCEEPLRLGKCRAGRLIWLRTFTVGMRVSPFCCLESVLRYHVASFYIYV
jgi:hypothetical protein